MDGQVYGHNRKKFEIGESIHTCITELEHFNRNNPSDYSSIEGRAGTGGDVALHRQEQGSERADADSLGDGQSDWEIRKSRKPIKYIDNIENSSRLYTNFFDNEGNQRGIVDSSVFEGKALDYDFYLMHDSLDIEDYRGILSDKELENWEPHWYGVFISKQTIDNAIIDSDLDIQKSFKDNNYELRYVASDNKFLINRMIFKDSGGENIFNIDDIIVSTVNNINLPFILELGSHWNFKPFSLGMNKEANVNSNTNSAIISMGNGNNHYESGYYDVSVRYSLDSNTQEQKVKRARILVR